MRALAHALLALVIAGQALAAAKVKMFVNVSTSGARVVVDGVEISASAPQRLEIEVLPGEHTVRVEREGFRPWEEKVVAGVDLNVVDVLLKTIAPEAAPAPPARASAPVPPTVLAPIRVAVYELTAGQGIEARTSRIVTEALLSEVRKLERVSAISMKEIQEMLSFEQQRQLLGCGDDACLTEIAGALGVDELVSGSLGELGDSHLINIKRLDMKAAQVRGAIARRMLKADGEEFLSAVGPAVEELFKEYPLREGRKRGVSQELARRLNPPPLPRWVFIATASSAAAAVAAGSFFALSFIDAQEQYNTARDRSLREPVPAAELSDLGARASDRASYANIAFAVAGSLALAAGLEAFFTNWADPVPADADTATASVIVEPLIGGVRVSWR